MSSDEVGIGISSVLFCCPVKATILACFIIISVKRRLFAGVYSLLTQCEGAGGGLELQRQGARGESHVLT